MQPANQRGRTDRGSDKNSFLRVFAGPLHFGNSGGLPLKLLWLANAWGALFITGNSAWLVWRCNRRFWLSEALGPEPFIFD